jgi:DNA-binding XRE family transcriptional regulator
MNKEEFQASRLRLGKTQKQLSELLGTSLKAIQSFEQGWRKVPVHIERQILFLLALQKGKTKEVRTCWDVQECPPERRRGCPAWELNAGNLCWFINGTICEGRPRVSWSSKMKICRRCRVFKNTVGISGSRNIAV